MTSLQRILVCICAMVGAALSGSGWSYKGGSGAEYWSQYSAVCNGERQSPINIYEGDIGGATAYSSWTLTNYDVATAEMTMSNNGHSAVVSLPANLGATVAGGGLPGTFEAVQFHFHWGSDSRVGSEHLINTHSYPMELHIVHYNTKYADIGEAIGHSDGLAVLGFMYEVSTDDNPNYNDLATQLSEIVRKGEETSLASTTLNSLLPDAFGHFYRYDGSLTTPMCQESVTWTVFTDSIKISEAQLAAFRDLEDEHNFHLVNNYRPPQNIYTRVVTANFDPHLHWGYFGHMGTEDWKNYYSSCAKTSQSPINIVSGIAEEDLAFEAFNYVNYDTTTGVTMTLKNNGHAAQVDVTGANIKISGGNLSDEFTLAQFHFHWGSTQLQGSEHLINGVKYPMEVHLVHYKTSLGSLGDAATTPGGLAVLGFMFEVTSTANSDLTPIVSLLSQITNPDDSINLPAITLESFLPASRSNFYRYQGSLTTPGCFETVTWTVFDQSIPVSEIQLEAFRSLVSSETDDDGEQLALVDNYRPPLPINGRTLIRNFVPSSSPHWTYEGDHGATHWKDDFKACGGTQQSPINIDPLEVQYDGDMESFTLENYDITEGIFWNIQNNGHSVVVNVDDYDFYKVSGGKLPGKFNLAQFHFHWGSDNTQGSEHTIDDEMYPMELHLVHYNKEKYATIGESLGHWDGLAVLGFMFKVVSEANPHFIPLINMLAEVKQPYAKTAMQTLKLRDLISTNLDDFYRYNGSLTTPGCNEAVTWTVFNEPIPISQVQLDEFRALLSSDKDANNEYTVNMVNNYRPVQPVEQRTVYANFEIGRRNGASGLYAVSWAGLLVCATLLAGLL